MIITGWGVHNRIRLAIDNSFLTEDLTDFPIVIRMDTSTDDVFKKVIYNTCYNFDRLGVEYKETGQLLPVEIRSYDIKLRNLEPLEITNSTVYSIYQSGYDSKNVFIDGDSWVGGTDSQYKFNIDFGRPICIQYMCATNPNSDTNYSASITIYGSNNYDDFNTTDTSYTSNTLIFKRFINLVSGETKQCFNIPNIDYYRYYILYISGVGNVSLSSLEFSGSNTNEDQYLILWTKLPYYKKDEDNYLMLRYGNDVSNGVDDNIILLQSNNDDGDYTFVDPFCPPRKITNYGNVKHSTTTYKIGKSSIRFSGNNYLSFEEADVDFDLNEYCWSISFYIHPLNDSLAQDVFCLNYGNNKKLGATYNNGTLQFYITVGGTEYTVNETISSNTWTFIHIYRAAGGDKIYINNNNVDIGNTNTKIDYEPNGKFYIGFGTKNQKYFEGYIDHFHVFKRKDINDYSNAIEDYRYIGNKTSIMGSAVWTNNYIAVFHLESEEITENSALITDSTINKHTAYIHSKNINSFMNTDVGKGFKFVPTDKASLVSSGTLSTVSGTSFSIETFNYEYTPTTTSGWPIATVLKENYTVQFGTGTSQDDPYTGRRGVYNGEWHYGGQNNTPNNWYHDVFSYDETTTSGFYYINGEQDTLGYFPHTLSGITISGSKTLIIAASV